MEDFHQELVIVPQYVFLHRDEHDAFHEWPFEHPHGIEEVQPMKTPSLAQE